MNTNNVSPIVYSAHASAAHEIAQQYLANLAKDTDNSLGTLDAMMHTFRYDIAERVAKFAGIRGAHNVRCRDVLVAGIARSEIRRSLQSSPALARKLIAIRAAQDAKRQAEIAAERASWVALPE